MYNGFYKYKLEKRILYPKEFDFQADHSTDHPIIQFINKILEAFENNLHTMGVLIDPFKCLCYSRSHNTT